MPDPFRPPEREIGWCAKCGVEDLKRNMRTLFVGDLFARTPKVRGHLCCGCMKQLLEELGLENE